MILCAYRAEVVLGAVSGVILEEDGLDAIHELYDFLFPGIHPAWVMFAHPALCLILVDQHPNLGTLPLMDVDASTGKRLWKEWRDKALPTFPRFFLIEGTPR